jgi:hypothetical protein
MLLLATGNYAEKLFLRKFGVVKGAIFIYNPSPEDTL